MIYAQCSCFDLFCFAEYMPVFYPYLSHVYQGCPSASERLPVPVNGCPSASEATLIDMDKLQLEEQMK